MPVIHFASKYAARLIISHKMKFSYWSFLILLSSPILTCYAANSTSKPEDYVVQLKVFLKEDKVPEYILDVLNNSLVEYDINVDDIIILTGLNLINLDETIKVLRRFNVSNEKGFSVDSLESALNVTKLPFKTFYDQLLISLNISSESARNSLSHLSINDTQFSEALMLRPENIYNILRNGSYTIENVERALDAINKTMPELYITAKSIVLLQASNELSSSELMDSLKKLGLNRQVELELWKAFELTSRDVYRSDKFRKILEEKSKRINENIMLIAVLTSPNKLTIHKTLFDKLGNDVSESNEQVQVQPATASSDNSTKYNFVELAFQPATTKYVNISTNYTEIKNNCSYVTFVNDVIRVEQVQIDANTSDGSGVIARKNAGTPYYLGSPLICGGKLVGMARQEDGSRIIFDTFWKPHVVWHLAAHQNHSNGTVHSGVNGLHSVFSANVVMVILVVFIKNLQN